VIFQQKYLVRGGKLNFLNCSGGQCDASWGVGVGGGEEEEEEENVEPGNKHVQRLIICSYVNKKHEIYKLST